MRKLDAETIEAAAWGNGDAVTKVELKAKAFLSTLPAGEVCSASKLMGGIAPLEHAKKLGSALWHLRQRDSFRAFWTRGKKKTLGGNLRIEYLGMKF